MNGKITAIRRQERSGHRLQARLRTPGLVRPGAAVETRPDAHRYRGRKCVPPGTNVGGTAEGMAFRPNVRDEGSFVLSRSYNQLIFYNEEH